MSTMMGGTTAMSDGQRIDSLKPETQQIYEDIVQTLQRDVNILSEPTSDRISKRKSLERIQLETLGKRSISGDRVLMRHVFGTLCKPLVRCLADSVEKCREMSMGLIVSLAEAVDDITPSLPYIVPAIVSRLGQPDIVEPAEEVRLLLTQGLVRLVALAGPEFGPYVEEAVKVLQRTFQDPFPDVKKESCQLVIELAKTNKGVLAYHGATVAKAIVPCLQHRHSSVRTSGLQAMREAMLVDISGLEEVLDPLRQLTLDKSQSVRESLYVTAGEWMLKLPDRWSIAYKILPLLLAGMTDELPKLINLSRKYMEEIGKLYEADWEDRVKDELDYVQNGQTDDRPRVGCRHVARDNTQKIVQKTVEGLADWNADVRIKSAQVLGTFITYAGAQMTGYTGVILPALYRILAGDECSVMKEASSVAELIGRYVDPDIYLDLIIPALRTGGGSSTQFRMGCLRTLEGLLRGTPIQRLTKARLERLVDLLNERELVHNENTELLAQVASVVAEVATKVPPPQVGAAGATPSTTDGAGASSIEEMGRAGYGLFVASAQLSSVPGDVNMPGVTILREKCGKALGSLATAYGLFGTQDLYALYFDQILETLASTQPRWTRYSPEVRLLHTVLVNAGPLLGQRLDVVIPLLVGMAGVDRDFEVRDSMFNLLLLLLQSPAISLNSTGSLPTYSHTLLADIILVNGVWKAGRKAAFLRGKVVRTLLVLLESDKAADGAIGLLSIDALNRLWEKQLQNVLVGTLEDDELETRRDTLKVLRCLLNGGIYVSANVHKILYQELLKRMDDAHDIVRLETAVVWKHFFGAVERWLKQMEPLATKAGGATTVYIDAQGNLAETGEMIEVKLDDVHWTAMAKGLVVHMDDTNPELQQSVFEALRTATPIIPSNILKEHLMAVRGRHRSPRYIDLLLEQTPNV